MSRLSLLFGGDECGKSGWCICMHAMYDWYMYTLTYIQICTSILSVPVSAATVIWRGRMRQEWVMHMYAWLCMTDICTHLHTYRYAQAHLCVPVSAVTAIWRGRMWQEWVMHSCPSSWKVVLWRPVWWKGDVGRRQPVLFVCMHAYIHTYIHACMESDQQKTLC
jgi:hypothetical protein